MVIKNLEYYFDAKYPYKIEVLSEEEGGGLLITYPDLLGCMSDGDTLEEALQMGEDARKAWIETKFEKGEEIPEPFSADEHYSGRITLRTPKSLHRLLAEKAQKEGISLNQYLIYLLSLEANKDHKI